MPRHPVQDTNRRLAKAMRRPLTKAEFYLWVQLREWSKKGLRFRRQVPIGPYIVDFLCPPARLVIEIDGNSHTSVAALAADARRSEWLRSRGYEVVERAEVISAGIVAAAMRRMPSPPPEAG